MIKTLYLKSYGLINPTEISDGNRKLITQGLDVRTLCNLWKWYFNIFPFTKIELKMSSSLYQSMKQRISNEYKSVEEIFKQNDFNCIEDKNL